MIQGLIEAKLETLRDEMRLKRDLTAATFVDDAMQEMASLRTQLAEARGILEEAGTGRSNRTITSWFDQVDAYLLRNPAPGVVGLNRPAAGRWVAFEDRPPGIGWRVIVANDRQDVPMVVRWGYDLGSPGGWTHWAGVHTVPRD